MSAQAFEKRDTDEATAAQILGPWGYKFVVSPDEQSSLVICGQPPPGPNHGEIVKMAGFNADIAKGGMCMADGRVRTLVYFNGDTDLPNGGASEDEFRAAAERGVILFVRPSP